MTGEPTEYDTLDVVSDRVRVYDVTDDGAFLRVERVHEQRGMSTSVSTTHSGRVDLAALAAFPDEVPVIDMADADDDLAAFGRELVA